MNNNITSLVLSYSQNKLVVKGFLDRLSKFAEFLLNTNIVTDKSFGLDNELICDDNSFSTRLIYALNKIETDYFILFLDDYYLTDYLNESSIQKCIDSLEKNKSAIGYKLIYENNFTQGLKRPPIKYGLSLAATIWKRDDFLNLMRKNETAWHIEILGSIRLWFTGKKIFFPKTNIVQYPPGGVIHKGKVPLHLTEMVSKEIIEKKGILNSENKPNGFKRRLSLLLKLILNK